jgi:hypothetical protein
MSPMIYYSILAFAAIATLGIGLFIYKQWTDDLQNPVRNLILAKFGYERIAYSWMNPIKAFKLSRKIPKELEYLLISHENSSVKYVFYNGELYDVLGLTYQSIWEEMFYHFDNISVYNTQFQDISIAGLVRSWRMKGVVRHFEYIRTMAANYNTFHLSDFNFGEQQVISKCKNIQGLPKEDALKSLVRNLPHGKTRTQVLKLLVELKESKRELKKLATLNVKHTWMID